ncbi:hypothetical protein FNF29_03058 [Cafeteria roenbergensis]|uniref:Crossover junction endonuclease MUS81-like HHH domain-containing protein n=1 Tax=Cafeteria roenbergensis TaxID=33653 RepID=A0A5A8CNG2_CAFRO|nr:hypothetical protein FNF29_03058 [Cafeteria roenbergensis]|eukprot:KAA0153670.1 hypothetical protein FNF29_03058 [Cafeteria roenbergensis]
MPKRTASAARARPKKVKMTKYDDKDPKPLSEVNLNKHITDELEAILAGFKREGADIFKIRGLAKAIGELKTWGVEIKTPEDAALSARIKGVGKSTVAQIVEIVEHGSSLRAAAADANKTDAERAVEELSTLEGVGHTIASRLADNNITSFKDLRAAITTSSTVLRDCKVPEAGIAHAPWVEETLMPLSRADAERLRDAIAPVAKELGMSTVELSGAYARGAEEMSRVKLLVVADDWTFEHRVDELAAKTRSAARAFAKGGKPEDNMPDFEGFVDALTKAHVAHATLRKAAHMATVVCVPGATGTVVPAGTLCDAGKRADGKAIKAEKPGAGGAAAAAKAEPADTSMAAAAPVTGSKAAKSAASKLAAMLPDLDDAEAEDEAATSASAVWDKGQLSAVADFGSSSSSSAAAPSATTAAALTAAAASEDSVSRDEVQAKAAKERGRLGELAREAIERSGRTAPFGAMVQLVLVPRNFLVSARVICSFSSDALQGLRARMGRKGVSMGSIGLTKHSGEFKESVSKDGAKKSKTPILCEKSEEITSEAQFWATLGMEPIPLPARG